MEPLCPLSGGRGGVWRPVPAEKPAPGEGASPLGEARRVLLGKPACGEARFSPVIFSSIFPVQCQSGRF